MTETKIPGLTVERIDAGCEVCLTEADVGYIIFTDEQDNYLLFACKPCYERLGHAGIGKVIEQRSKNNEHEVKT